MLKALKRKNIKLNFPIDVVFPYVDCNDPNWQALYNEAVTNRKNDDKLPKSIATGEERFRSNGLLKYVFRSIGKYLPWVNKVHMIVQSDSQVPEWINREKVNIVYHEDFIPKEYLPTFNSGTIEMFLHNIKDLSENFLYSNDDVFINDFFKPTDFFMNDKPMFKVKIRKIHPNWIWDMTLRLNDQKLLGLTDKFIYDVQHTILPYKKSVVNKIFEIYKTEIHNSISQFRLSKNYNHWIFALYCYKNDLMINKGHKYLKTSTCERIYNKIKLRDNWNKYKTLCLNDSADTTNELMEKYINLFALHFPNKSKYEL